MVAQSNAMESAINVSDNDAAQAIRAERLQILTNDFISGMSPQERDRLMQVHLAQARGAVRNAELLRHSINRRLRIKAQRRGTELALDDPFVNALSAVVAALNRSDIPYAITGSVASGLHGVPVCSRDIDVVVRMTPAQAHRLASELPRRFNRNKKGLCRIAENGGIVYLVDSETALRFDVSVPSATKYLDAIFERRTGATLGASGPEFHFVSAEDVILMKLIWRKDTRSAKQWENALGVARVKGARMDWKYLFEQARALGIEDDLIKLRDEAGI